MARYKKDLRKDDFGACANSLGWEFKEIDDAGTVKWLKDFKLCRFGHPQTISPIIIHESDDLGFTCAFDYIYTVSSGKSSHTYRQTVYFRYSKELALPHFVMVPEKWYHRIGTYFGMQDIDFIQYPTFSKNYLLRGEDEDYIRYHFDNPDLIRFFDSQGFYSLEGMNYLLILYVHDVIMPQAQILQLIRIGDTIHDYLAHKTPDIELPEFKYPI